MPDVVRQQEAIRESAISWCKEMINLLLDLMDKLAIKRAGIKVPEEAVGAPLSSLPLSDEENEPFGVAINILLSVIYHLRESPPKKEDARSELLRIKEQLIPKMEERLKRDTEFRDILSGIKRHCDNAIKTVEALVPSLLVKDVEDMERGSGQSAVRKAILALQLSKSRLFKAEGEARRATILERIKSVERYWNDAARLLWSRFRNNVDEITEALSEVKACVATEEFSLDTLREKVNKLCDIATKFLNSEEVQKYINETLEGVREEGLPARFAVGAWCVDEFKSQLEALCSEVQGSAVATEGPSTAKSRLFKLG